MTTRPTCPYSHRFSSGNPLAARRTFWAMLLTLVMMIAEISGGLIFNSMALLADGWHMSSHVLALGLAVLAYHFSRRLAHDGRFAFGTWKIEVLGGYTSALLLLLVAGMMAWHSVERLLNPADIRYDEAIVVTVLGLAVNAACIWLLHDGGHGHHHAEHHHHHGHDHGHHDQGHHGHAHPAHGHHDLNLRSAYLHVIADAATSVLAIIALTGGKLWGADWLDPVMGLVGAALVAWWARGLLRETSAALLDADMHAPVVAEIREAVDADPDARLNDLHVWRVGSGQYACLLSLEAGLAQADALRERLSVHEELVHISIEHRPA